MNRSAKMILAGLAIVALSASAYAHEDRECGWKGMDREKMEKAHEQHQAKLHDKLKLSAQQETAWKKFTASHLLLYKKDRPDPAALEKLNAPQRLEKGLELLRAEEAQLAEHLKALKEFYAVLTPEQQKIFDEQIPHRGMHGQKHEK